MELKHCTSSHGSTLSCRENISCTYMHVQYIDRNSPPIPVGLNSSMGRVADWNPEGVSSNLASDNTFFVLVKDSVRDHA